MSSLPPPRRIVASNSALPLEFTDVASAEPAVHVVSETVVRQVELDGHAARGTVFTHKSLPTSNSGLDIKPLEVEGGGVVIPKGANIRFNDLGPRGRVPMHRTSTTDYDVFISGSVTLITPGEAYDIAAGKGKVVETTCFPGDVVMMRGALHAWENRSDEWIRFLSVMIGAEPTTVSVEGEHPSSSSARALPDCFDV